MSASTELVRRCYAAWNRGDFTELENLLAPDLEIDATDRVINPDRYTGLAGFRRLVADLSDVWEAWHIELPEMVENGERIFVAHEVHARGKGSGIELVRTYWSVWTVRGDRVVKLSLHVERDPALAAAGLTSGSWGTSTSSGSRPTGP